MLKRKCGLSGRSIAPGLGMGQAWVVGDVLKCSGAPSTIGESDVDGELARLKRMRSRKRWRSSINTPSGSRPNSIRRSPGCFAPMARCCEICFRRASSSGSYSESLLTAEAVVRRVLQRWYQEV